jgi:tetratricopeptide (TPR) repeat protein
LGRLLGVSYPGGTDGSLPREELFAGWRLFFERLADVSPVILLVEDAQHADPALLDFLDHLIDWARNSPIYVLVFARPELEEQRPGWATGRNRTALTLDPLDARSMDTLVDALVPGMPASAIAAIAAQAQGNPLFAVETVRSLIDRDVVVPIEGVYRLVGEVGELSVPDSLHALLAARLDALDPTLRALVADAAVLGTSFPAEALVAISGRDTAAVEAGLAELLRREVFEIYADPLSPQRGAYRFSQSLLRQVAYDTLARRDRKQRHLAVAAHLRSTFANDGEEIAEVIARHYLDALAAVPDDPDTPDIRGSAIAMLIRAAERAERSGAPGRAGETFAEVAELTEHEDVPDSASAAARWWERAARAALTADLDATLAYAARAGALYLAHGQVRAAARTQGLAGRAFRQSGRLSDARQRITEAMAVLGAEPDGDTVEAMSQLATLETFEGRPDAHRLASEALALGQALDVGPGGLAELFITRGLAALVVDRTAEAAADFEYAIRLAQRAGDTFNRGRAGLNLTLAFLASEPASAVATGRAAVDALRQIGDRAFLPHATCNLALALWFTGEWDEAERVLQSAVDVDGLDDESVGSGTVATYTAVLRSLRGEPAALPDDKPGVAAVRNSDDPQNVALCTLLDAAHAVAEHRLPEAVVHARAALAQISAVGLTSEFTMFAWPLAVRTAFELGEAGVVDELLALLDGYPVGHVPPLLRAERALARARQRSAAADPVADSALAAAVNELRAAGSPYHLAHALLDRAEHLAGLGSAEEAELLRDEARGIADRLGDVALRDRADAALSGQRRRA